MSADPGRQGAGAAERGAAPEADLPASAQRRERPGKSGRRSFTRTRRYLSRFSTAGLTGALVCYCLSLTPSLLPRAWFLQAVMSGVTTVIGYGVGTVAGWLLRSLVPWSPGRGVRLAGRWVLAVAAIVLIPLFGVLGAEWQHQIRELVEAGQPSEVRYVLVVVVSILIALGLLTVARAIRSMVRVTARPLGRVLPPHAAASAAVLVVVLILGFLATDVLPRAAVGTANTVFSGVDSGTAAGITEPVTALRSGSPASLVHWATLGRQGRTFVDSGPTETEISKFTGTAAMEPIRLYVGLKSAATLEGESSLAVRELERTGAFRRKVIVVATTTGTGWLNPAMIDPLEYMYDGNTAVVTIQYSFLPSWLSFLVDKAAAQEAGRDLFDAVYEKWLQQPADRRPALAVFGESLGSFGGEAAFSGTDDIRDRASGVFWVGPTNSNTLWSRFTAAREPGSPEWRPVYQGGRTVRFGDSPADFNPGAPGWERPRVVYLQNPSDPIVWWSWRLAFHQPDWLRGARPPDVSPAMRWYPLVTFWQVAGDLALATAVPAGHGHTYGMLQGTGAWASVLPVPGWSQARTAELGKLPAN